jgi:hypothetical protein
MTWTPISRAQQREKITIKISKKKFFLGEYHDVKKLQFNVLTFVNNLSGPSQKPMDYFPTLQN